MSTATGISRLGGSGLELTSRMLKEHRDERLLEEEERIMGGRLLDEQADRFFRAVMRGEVDSSASLTVNLSARDKRAVMEQRDLSKLTDAAGRYTVASDFVRLLYENIVEVSAVRRIASVFTTAGGQNLPVPKATGATAASIVTEGGAIPEADPSFGQVVLGAYKYAQLIDVSNELLADSAVDLGAYIARQAGRALGLGSGAHFVTGTGTAQPEGIMTNMTTGKTGTTGQTTTVLADDLVDLYHSVPTGYRENGTWIMRDATKLFIAKIKEATGGFQYVFNQGVNGGPDTILGRPVVTDPTMPAMAAGADSIAFGDFEAYYAIREVVGVRIDQAQSQFANDITTFRVSLRTDGKPVDTTAAKCYTNAAS
jgi:HK97 family phage major capsid protein